MTERAKRALRLTMVAFGLSIAAALAYALSGALYPDRAVGFGLATATGADGKRLAIGVWYPTHARPLPTTLLGMNLISVARDGAIAGNHLPLVVISHGNGGGIGSHVDLALALAQRGFVVAAPMHRGDNYADESALASAAWLVERSREVRSTIDYLLHEWPGHERIDPARIGMFGYSAGGFTALSIIGGQPDLRRIASHCAAAPEFVCGLLVAAHSPLLDPARGPAATDFAPDDRVKAAVVVAPALGFTFVPGGLARVDVPVQLWTGGADRNVPTPSNAALVRTALGGPVEFHDVPGAGHFSFLVPCGLFGPPLLCRDTDGFDRKRFHGEMNDAIARFFRSAL
jgi:predicted dienelactone hydrolase